jgi:hypothetical protein
MTARAQEIRTGLAWLQAVDPVLAQVIDDRPGFDPDIWIQRLPAMDLFGACCWPTRDRIDPAWPSEKAVPAGFTAE